MTGPEVTPAIERGAEVLRRLHADDYAATWHPAARATLDAALDVEEMADALHAADGHKETCYGCTGTVFGGYRSRAQDLRDAILGGAA